MNRDEGIELDCQDVCSKLFMVKLYQQEELVAQWYQQKLLLMQI